MGILNPKERILDTIITQEGKSQIASGKLIAEYVSFSDMGSVYKLDTIISGGLDVTYRFCLEATNLPQDLITFEADDSGKLVGVFVSESNSYNVSLGQIFSGSVRNGERLTVSGAQFSSLSSHLLSSSIDNFKKLYTLSSPDIFNQKHDNFITFPKNLNFTITNNKPINTRQLQEVNIDAVESLFFDKRLANVPNFDFLPPINKKHPGEHTGRPLGQYLNLNQRPYVSQEDLFSEINAAIKNGFEEKIYFTETSRENNLLSQFFEISNDEMTKLDVIDFGSFPADAEGVSRHVFFVGKVFVDDYKTSTYVNMFMLVFES